MINTSQLKTNGNFGITQGTITATQDRDRVYENQNIISKFLKKSAQSAKSARVEEIQHHQAHFASILGEKKLWKK